MTWDKTKPAGGLAPSVGDDAIRANNEHLELALGAEHDFPGSGTAGPRRHKFPRGDLAARNALTGMVAGSVFFRTDAGEIDVYDGAAWTPYALTPAGVVMDWAGAAGSIPAGWLLCDGAEVAKATYAALWAAFGSTHLHGTPADPTNNFLLPNAGGRVRVGYVSGGDVDGDYGTMGETDGEKEHALIEAELASHSHAVTDPGHSHTQQIIGAASLSVLGGATYGNTDTATSPNTTGITLGATGSGAAHENRQPFIVFATIIKI